MLTFVPQQIKLEGALSAPLNPSTMRYDIVFGRGEDGPKEKEKKEGRHDYENHV